MSTLSLTSKKFPNYIIFSSLVSVVNVTHGKNDVIHAKRNIPRLCGRVVKIWCWRECLWIGLLVQSISPTRWNHSINMTLKKNSIMDSSIQDQSTLLNNYCILLLIFLITFEWYSNCEHEKQPEAPSNPLFTQENKGATWIIIKCTVKILSELLIQARV